MQTRRRRTLGFIALAVLAAAALAAPARAGIYYEAVTRGERPKDEVRVQAWVDGGKAKIEFQQSGNPMMPAGTYLLTPDGGQTLYLVNPVEKTYSRWDLEAMLRAAFAAMESMGPLLNLEISDPEVQKLGEEAGGTLVGLPTTLARYRTAYDMQIKVMGIKRASHVEMDQQIWTTDAVTDPGLGVWLRKERPTGNETFDKLVAAEMSKVQGFPLKTVTVTTTSSGKKGKQQQARSETEVTVLDRDRAIPASTFEIPAGYQETQMPAMEGEGEGESDSPFGGLFKRGGG